MAKSPPAAGARSPGTTGFDLVDRIRHLVLPALVLAVQLIAVYSRYMRASLIEVMSADYIRTARAAGAADQASGTPMPSPGPLGSTS